MNQEAKFERSGTVHRNDKALYYSLEGRSKYLSGLYLGRLQQVHSASLAATIVWVSGWLVWTHDPYGGAPRAGTPRCLAGQANSSAIDAVDAVGRGKKNLRNSGRQADDSPRPASRSRQSTAHLLGWAWMGMEREWAWAWAFQTEAVCSVGSVAYVHTERLSSPMVTSTLDLS